jgi:hypothetical protein
MGKCKIPFPFCKLNPDYTVAPSISTVTKIEGSQKKELVAQQEITVVPVFNCPKLHETQNEELE